jgi:tRNA-dihydrouridine synthase
MAGQPVRAPSPAERLALCRRHLLHNVAARGERRGVMALRRHLHGYLSCLPGGMELRRALLTDETLAGNLALIDAHAAAVGSRLPLAGSCGPAA